MTDRYQPESMHPIPLPALSDNYIWALHNTTHAWVVDPGDASPVQAWLSAQGLSLAGILLTHHHADHTGGVDALRLAWACPVYGPAFENLPEPVTRLSDGDTVEVLGRSFQVLEVPGHTAGHIAYFAPAQGDAPPVLFCGDTLFSGGCGRLFEGTPAQMLASLDRLGALPGDTLVCCTHEYTLSNLRFARAVEPGNAALVDYQRRCQGLRDQGSPTLPSTIAQENTINPFLRSRQASVAQAVRAHQAGADDVVAVFADLRAWKNNF